MLETLDLGIFRFFNRTLASPWLDPVMEFLSGNSLFIPMVVALVVALVGWGGRRGRVFVVVLAFVLAVGDPILVGKLKRLIRRDRPFVTHSETRLVAGRGSSFSMPSGHSAIWGAITSVTFLLYRRRWVPVAVLGFGVGISRMYLGVHYPTDVLAGWTLGAVYGVVLSRMAAWLWGQVGSRFFPEWHRALPRLLSPDEGERLGAPVHGHWERLGVWLLVLLLVGRWVYVGVPVIELSEDEAYQWVWSKRLAWSYYSKPFGIALAHWLGTRVGGDTEFGVRFLPPLLSAVLGYVCLRWVARRTDGRTAFLFLLAVSSTPLLAVGSILLTIDPLTVFFYTLGMFAAWRAVTEDSTRWWALFGVTLAGSLLTKYFAPFQVGALLLGLALVPGGLRQLGRPGPYVALGILALGTFPILYWNAQNGWITFTHLSERGGLNQAWRFNPNFVVDFVAAEFGLLNPVWLLLVVPALWAVLRSRTAPAEERFLAAFSAPVFLFYLFYTLRARVQPNWVAASVLPGMLAATLYWHRRWREGRAPWIVPKALVGGIVIGFPLVVLVHETNLVGKLAGRLLPAKLEPLKRVRGYRDLASQVAAARTNLMAEGKPVFVIADHYGRAGLLSFYMPGGPESLPEAPFVYEVRRTPVRSQFGFWPGYEGRKGENALYVREKSRQGADPLPVEITGAFERVEALAPIVVTHRDRVFHEYEVYACRGKR